VHDAKGLIDEALARWCQAGRSMVPVSEVADLLLDLRRCADFVENDREVSGA